MRILETGGCRAEQGSTCPRLVAINTQTSNRLVDQCKRQNHLRSLTSLLQPTLASHRASDIRITVLLHSRRPFLFVQKLDHSFLVTFAILSFNPRAELHCQLGLFQPLAIPGDTLSSLLNSSPTKNCFGLDTL